MARMSRRMSLAIRLRAFRAAHGLWWHTGMVDIVLGAWGLASAIVLIARARGVSLSTTGIVLLVVFAALALMLSLALVWSIVVPGGFVISATGRGYGETGPALVADFIYLAAFVWGLFGEPNSRMYICIGALVASLAIDAYRRCGKRRYFYLSLWIMVSFAFLPNLLAPLGASGMRAAGIALLLCSAGLLVSGVPTMFGLLVGLASRIGDQEGDDALILQGRKWYTPAEIDAALTSTDADRRFLTAAFLVDYAESAVLPTIIKATHDPDDLVAYLAKRALEGAWGPDPEEVVQWEVAHGRGIKRTRRDGLVVDVEEMKDLKRKRDAAEKQSITHEKNVEETLGKLASDEPEAFEELLDLASKESEDTELRYAATELLGSTRDHRAYATLVRLLVQDGRDLAEAAAEGFKGARADAVIHLEPLFKDAREWVRIAAINAGLCLIGSLDGSDEKEAGIARLMLKDSAFSLAAHPNPVTRANALELVAQYGNDAVPCLEQACGDRFAMVRGEAVRTLAKVSRDHAVEHVMNALGDAHAFVRANAVECVSKLELAEAMPEIIRLESDPDSHVANLAKQVHLVSQLW